MSEDPLKRLRAANPLPGVPTPGSPERVRRLIDDGHAPRATPYRAPRRSAWLVATVALVALLALATIALAATGVILAGAPVHPEEVLNPNVGLGVPAPGTPQLLALRVPDRAGGPPWGMRILRTTRGETCIQIGRVQHGQLGELGIGGAFHNDGRFHPIPVNALPRDEFHHHVFDTLLGTSTVSCQLNGQAVIGEHIGVSPSAAAELPSGSRGGLRNLYYGLLGSRARRVGYHDGSKPHSVAVLRPLGAYLIVTPTSAHQQIASSGESLGTFGNLQPSPPLTSITYLIDGKTCQRGPEQMPGVRSQIAHPCPRPHYPTGRPPIRDLHRRVNVRLLVKHHIVTGAVVSFVAPFAVTSARDRYIIFVPQVSCHARAGEFSGSAESTARNIRAGALVSSRIPNPFDRACPGHPVRVLVKYGHFPAANVIVGGATIRRPPGTHDPPAAGGSAVPRH